MKQCDKCPWKADTDPYEIPNGYDLGKHEDLESTIAAPCDLRALIPGSALPMMACHESKPGDELPCVGWLSNQLGPGNNLGLRMAMLAGKIEPFELVGEQHECFEDTLP